MGLGPTNGQSMREIESSPEILDISSPLTKSAVFHIPKKIKHGGREDSNGKEADLYEILYNLSSVEKRSWQTCSDFPTCLCGCDAVICAFKVLL